MSDASHPKVYTSIRHRVILQATQRFISSTGKPLCFRTIHTSGDSFRPYYFRDANTTFNFEIDESITTTSWHSDVSYELQPPGLTTFFLLSSPETGGDTLFTSQVATLRRLSPQFIAFLRTLKAVHSGIEQADFSRSGKRGATVRREPVEHIHPVVRRHPVTGEEALYVNRQFTRRIVGLKREESGMLRAILSAFLVQFLGRRLAGDCSHDDSLYI
jgi:alpha-ketoglutarate-dependent taurine dioxygenase